MVSTVQALCAAFVCSTSDEIVSGRTSGESPESTTTGPEKPPRASRTTRTAWPVPRRSVCSTNSTSASSAK